jgi:O-antigen/teichoic acid export membrane protein
MRGRLVASPDRPSLRHRLAPFRRTIGTTGGLIVATALNSATGFVFWWIAARAFPEAAVGLAGAAVAAMVLLSQISVLGLGTTLAGILHRERHAASLAVTALLTAGTAGIVLGGGFAIVAPLISDELAPIGASPQAAAIFAAGVGLTALSAVLDQALIAVLRSPEQLLRVAIFAFGRLALLVAAAAVVAPDGMAIYAAWAVATLISIAIIAVLPRHRLRLAEARPQLGRLRGMAFGALAHHILNLSRSSSIWLLPVIVTALLSSEANAAFYVALLLANFIAVIGSSATFTLYVVGARSPDQLWRQVRLTLGFSLLAASVGTLVLAVAGLPILAAFGPRYAEAAYPTVVILALSTIPLAVKDHWIAVQRLHGGLARASAIGVGALAFELGAGAAGAVAGGILGLSVARLGTLLIQAAFMAPEVYRACMPPRGPAQAATSEAAAEDLEWVG